MRYELRLLAGALLLLVLIAMSCRCESIAHALNVSGPAPALVTPSRGAIVETI